MPSMMSSVLFKKAVLLLLLSCCSAGLCQVNNLTGSPYSFFGLGVESNSGFGKFPGLGNGGIALMPGAQLNDNNPASLAFISEKQVIFDTGLYAEVNSISNRSDEERRIAANFSNMAFGFNGNGKWGMSMSLVPSTTVGYSLIGLEGTVEGSLDQFTANVLGSGGINSVKFGLAHKVHDRISLGIHTSYLFGKIEELENITLAESFLNINEKTKYRGFVFGLGAQYAVSDKIAIGLVLDTPVTLNARQDLRIEKALDFVLTVVEESTNEKVDGFTLPMHAGFGVSANFLSGFTANLDVNHKFWDATNQSDGLGEYIDQTMITAGLEYLKDPRGRRYTDRMSYRAGFSYDSGFLRVSDVAIDSYQFSLGLGLPLGKSSSSLNISYTRGFQGTVGGILVEENFNLVNINITLSDIWFLKRYYD